MFNRSRNASNQRGDGAADAPQRLVYCYACDAVKPAAAPPPRRAPSAALKCSSCGGSHVEDITEHENVAQTNNNTARGGGLSGYFSNFRRWAQARRAERQDGQRRRGDVRQQHVAGVMQRVGPFLQWLREVAAANNVPEASFFAATDPATGHGSAARDTQLPVACRDFTAEEILSTQVVLPDGMPSMAAWEAIQKDGEEGAGRAKEEGRQLAEDASRQRRGEHFGNGAAASPASADDTDDAQLPCCICLGEMLKDTTDAAVVLHCQHVFHYTCIFEWVDLENFSCPMCRTNIIRE